MRDVRLDNKEQVILSLETTEERFEEQAKRDEAEIMKDVRNFPATITTENDGVLHLEVSLMYMIADNPYIALKAIGGNLISGIHITSRNVLLSGIDNNVTEGGYVTSVRYNGRTFYFYLRSLTAVRQERE